MKLLLNGDFLKISHLHKSSGVSRTCVKIETWIHNLVIFLKRAVRSCDVY